MGLKLDDTEIDYENGGTIKSNSTSFSTHSYDGDDFNEDTVYIANRYASAAPVTPPSAAEIRAANNIFVKPTLMLAGAAIEILVYFIFGFLLQKYNFDVLTQFVLIGGGLIILSRILFIIDAIDMKKHGHGVTILIFAILFPPVYFFLRCRANGDSTVIAIVIILLIMAGSSYCNKQINALAGSQTGITVSDDYQQTISDRELADIKDNFSKSYYEVQGNKYYKSDIIACNITDPVYTFVPETQYSSAYVAVSGATDFRGKNEKIELHFDYETLHLSGIKLGLRSYTNPGDISDLLDQLFETTTPRE